MTSKEKPKSKVTSDELIDTTAESIGGVIGAAVGLIAAGPAGALVGGAAGPVMTLTIQKVATEIKNRFLSPCEERRIASALTYAKETIHNNQKYGRQLRQDGFFESSVDGRSPAEEIIEGILITAQRDQEERKLKYHGRLLGNICYSTRVSRSTANFLIRTVDRLSYRQILLLSFLGRLDELYNPDKNTIGEMTNYTVRVAPPDLVQETNNLQQFGLLEFKSTHPSSIYYRPETFTLSEIGELLYELMELENVEIEELNSLIEIFK